MGTDSAECLLSRPGGVDDTAYTDVDVGQATTSLPGTLFDQLQPPLDMLWMDAEKNDAIGEFPRQLACPGAFYRHVYGQRPLDPLRMDTRTLPFRRFAGCVGLDEADGLAKLLDRNGLHGFAVGPAGTQADEGTASGKLIDGGRGVGNDGWMESEGVGHPLSDVDTTGVQRSDGHHDMDVPIHSGRVGEADPGVAALIRCAGKLGDLVDVGDSPRTDAEVHVHGGTRFSSSGGDNDINGRCCCPASQCRLSRQAWRAVHGLPAHRNDVPAALRRSGSWYRIVAW